MGIKKMRDKCVIDSSAYRRENRSSGNTRVNSTPGDNYIEKRRC